MVNRGTGWAVLVVDDDPVRLKQLVADCGMIAGVGTVQAAASIPEAVGVLSADPQDVMIVDLDTAGLAQLAELGEAAKAGGTAVLAVTAGHSPMVLAELTKWASGFLARGPDVTDLGHALRVVRTGAFYMESTRARGMVEELDALRDLSDRGPLGESLTPREREVLRLLSEGMSARQMARRLELSERTINTHVANVYRKLAVSNRVQAVRQAIRLGLVTEPE